MKGRVSSDDRRSIKEEKDIGEMNVVVRVVVSV